MVSARNKIRRAESQRGVNQGNARRRPWLGKPCPFRIVIIHAPHGRPRNGFGATADRGVNHPGGLTDGRSRFRCAYGKRSVQIIVAIQRNALADEPASPDPVLRIAGLAVTQFAESGSPRESELGRRFDHGADLLAVGTEQGGDRNGMQDLHGRSPCVASIRAQPDLIYGFQIPVGGRIENLDRP